MRPGPLLLLLLFCTHISLAQPARKPVAPDLSAYTGRPVQEKLNAWLNYCDLFLGNEQGYEEDYPGLIQAARQGLAITPPGEFEYLSSFHYFIGAASDVPDTALRHLGLSLQYARRIGSEKKTVQAAKTLMNHYGNFGQREEVDRCRDILLSISDTTHDNQVKTGIYSALSGYYSSLGWYETSLDYLLKLILAEKERVNEERADDPGATTDYGVALAMAGELYMNLNQPDKALDFFTESLPFIRKYRSGTETIWKHMIGLFVATGRSDSATRYYRLLSGSADSSKNWDALAGANLGWACALIDKQQFNPAVYYLDRAQDYTARINSPILNLQYAMQKARVDISRKQYRQALEALIPQLDFAKDYDFLEYTDAHLLLAQAYEGLGNYRAATEYFSRHTVLADSVATQKASSSLAEKEARYRNREQKQNIELLHKKQTIQQMEIDRTRKRTYLLSAGLAVLGLIALLLYVIYRNKERNNHLLNEKNDALKTANDAKVRLLGIISHDLRAPIGRIYQFLRLKQNGSLPMDEAQRHAHEQKIESATAALLETIEDLLLWSKGQMNQFSPEITSVSLTEITAEVSQLCLGQAEEKQVLLKQDIPVSLFVETDENFLKIILRNLVQNAIRHTVPGTPVHIGWDARQYALQVTNEAGNVDIAALNEQLVKQTIRSGSSGLGLQMISDLAARIGIGLRFEQPGSGLIRAVISFTPAGPSIR